MNYYSFLTRHRCLIFLYYTIVSHAPLSNAQDTFVPILTPTHIPTRNSLCLDSTPLHTLPRVLLPLFVQELALLISTQSAQLGISLLLLQLVSGEFPLLCLLLVIRLLDLSDLLVTGLLDAAEGFRAEVCGRSELIGEAEEVLEDGEGGGVVRGELEGETETLLGLGFVETGTC
jgi:hypothetical protein